MPATSTRRRASASSREERGGRSEQVLPPLRVRYWRRMSRLRVYRVVVSWQKSSRHRPPRDAEPVTVRLVMPGSQVIPSEQAIDPTDPDAKVTFYATPLARGWLRAEHLQVLIDGRKVQEIALPSKVVGQKTTWILFFLTFLVPLLLANLRNVVETEPEPLKVPGQKEVVVVEQDLKPSDAMERQIKDEMPPMPTIVSERVPWAEHVNEVTTKLVAENYGRLIQLIRDYYIPVYAFYVLLFFTLISWFTHRNKRRRRTGQPIPLPRGADDY